MKYASAFLLAAFVSLAAAPPGTDEFAVTPMDWRGHGFLRIDNLPTQQGLVDVITPWEHDWCVVRLDDGPWSLPIPINALGGNKLAVEVTVTFCVSFPLIAPYGSVVGYSQPVQYTVSAGEPGDDDSLEADVAKVKAAVAAIGGVHVPCN